MGLFFKYQPLGGAPKPPAPGRGPRTLAPEGPRTSMVRARNGLPRRVLILGAVWGRLGPPYFCICIHINTTDPRFVNPQFSSCRFGRPAKPAAREELPPPLCFSTRV
jgi:hypothetical protein